MEEFNYIDEKYKSCSVCYDDFTSENIVYCKINNVWSQYIFCSECTKYLIKTKWFDYIKQIKNSDCEKELKSLLSKKIPLNLTIDSTMNTQEIEQFYLDNNYYSSELKKPTEINLDQLALKLNQVHLNMISDLTYDYLSQIKIIMNEFVL